MTPQLLSLDAIDFSNPDGEFTFRGETYLLKQYLNNYFIRNKRYTGLEFICVFGVEWLALLSSFPQNLSPQSIKESISRNKIINDVHRCVQYKEAVFGFGYITDLYYSSKYNKWIRLRHINYKFRESISSEEVFEKPYELLIEQAAIVYNQELPFIEDEALFNSLINKENQQIQFSCGSLLELKRLTKLVVFTLPELQPLFEHSLSLTVTYYSDNRYFSNGVSREIITEGGDGIPISKAAIQLFNLIFKYNFFIGLNWEHIDEFDGYPGYDPVPYDIEVEVQAPSQHERLEAALELQSWLEGKLPEDEIESYFNQ